MLSSKAILGVPALAAALLAAYGAGRAAAVAPLDQIVAAYRPPFPAAAPHRAKSALALPDLKLPRTPEEPADSFHLSAGDGQQSYPSPAQPPACTQKASCRL